MLAGHYTSETRRVLENTLEMFIRNSAHDQKIATMHMHLSIVLQHLNVDPAKQVWLVFMSFNSINPIECIELLAGTRNKQSIIGKSAPISDQLYAASVIVRGILLIL